MHHLLEKKIKNVYKLSIEIIRSILKKKKFLLASI